MIIPIQGMVIDNIEKQNYFYYIWKYIEISVFSTKFLSVLFEFKEEKYLTMPLTSPVQLKLKCQSNSHDCNTIFFCFNSDWSV